MIENSKKPRVHDDPAIREAYANKLISASFDGGAIVLTVGTTRMVPDRVDEAPRPGFMPGVYVTGRLAISPAAAVELINSLQGLLAIAARPPQAMTAPMPSSGKAN